MAGMMMGSSGFNDGFVWFIYMGRIEWDTFPESG
jgi:hypothetical protein